MKDQEIISCIVKNKSERLGTIMSVKNREQKIQMAKEKMLSFVKRNQIRKKYMNILLRKKV